MVDTSKRDGEIRLRHTKHQNSVKALSRFYGLSEIEIRTVLTCPMIATPAQITPCDPKNAFLQSVDMLITWVCDYNGIGKDQLRARKLEASRNARRMLAYNLRNRWGLDWQAISKVVGYQQAGLYRMVKACADRQMPPCSPPDPDMPKVYMRALRKIADRHGLTPYAVLRGGALVHHRAKLAFFKHMISTRKASRSDLAKVTGYTPQHMRHIMLKLKECV